MLIDHLISRAPDLACAVADVEERFGVRAQAGGRHIGLGTHNALLALGPRTYLEIIAPDPSQLCRARSAPIEPAAVGWSAGRLPALILTRRWPRPAAAAMTQARGATCSGPGAQHRGCGGG